MLRRLNLHCTVCWFGMLLALVFPQQVWADAPIGLETAPVWMSEDRGRTWSVAWGDVDGDGDLDLATADAGGTIRVYVNTGTRLETAAGWVSPSESRAAVASVAWGDVDGDGDLDLAVGHAGCNRLYLNAGGMLQFESVWEDTDCDNTTSIAWGDMDGDGYLDLAVGNDGATNKVYLNGADGLQTVAAWAVGAAPTADVAWGDMNGDGWLDLAVGNNNAPSYVYLNDSGSLALNPAWTTGTDAHPTQAVAWGDLNGDGYVDLLLGNDTAQNEIYWNNNGLLATIPDMIGGADSTYDIAVGDIDGDGDLDIAVANDSFYNLVYQNRGGVVQSSATWQASLLNDASGSVALGDVDGDGDLDLAFGNVERPNKLYLNLSPQLGVEDVLEVAEGLSDAPRSVAWGDMDNDGDLDLAVGNHGAPNKVYANVAGHIQETAVWTSTESEMTYSVAWGDVNGDGYLDLAVGNAGQVNRVYYNSGGILEPTASWVSAASENSWCVAFGDVNRDGYLDLAVANSGGANRVYFNDAGSLESGARWESQDGADYSVGVAWGDVDGDGDLDLAVANGQEQPNKLYLNVAGMLQSSAGWVSADADWTNEVAWGDIDGDGDLDLVAGNYAQANKLYLNDAGTLQKYAAWTSKDSDYTQALALGDVDADGDLDVVVANENVSERLYLNVAGQLSASAMWSSADSNHAYDVAWGDVDGDGDLDLATAKPGLGLYLGLSPALPGAPCLSPAVALSVHSSAPVVVGAAAITALAPADFYAVPGVREGTVSVSYTLFNPGGALMPRVAGWYSLDSGVHWLSAVPTPDTITQNLRVGSGASYAAQLSLPLVIPNGRGSVSATLEILEAAGLEIADVEVWLDMTHSAPADLRVYLSGPGGITVELLANSIASGISATQLVFSDRAWLDIADENGWLEGRYRPVDKLSAFVGMLANGAWQLEIYDDVSINDGVLNAWGLRFRTPSPEHSYTWDVFNSGVVGESDNVVFRLDAYQTALAARGNLTGTYLYTRAVAGPYQLTRLSTHTYPFRVRGSQVRVYSATQPISNALVYRLPAGQLTGAQSYAAADGQPFRTNSAGYLQGHGQIMLGDRLVALAPTNLDNAEAEVVCTTYTSQDVPLTIVPTATSLIRSKLAVPDAGKIIDVNVVNLQGTHTWLSDLVFTLLGPSGTSVVLLDGSCWDLDDFQLSLDDDAQSAWPCPPTDGGTYWPAHSLAAFADEDSRGTWTLQIADNFAADGGSLDNWGLEICTVTPDKYNTYYTNAQPIATGMQMHVVTRTGIQKLTVSPSYPLLLFNLDVALEWDAREDYVFMEQLAYGLRRASELIFDATDGQAALGQLTLYHNKEHWNDADIQVRASNFYIPNADVGGIVASKVADPTVADIVYHPGYVRIGANWNRYGSEDTGDEGWARSLIHELGHYLFYLYDTYLGYEGDLLTAVSGCTNTLMTDPFQYSEFRPVEGWEVCAHTLSARRMGARSEWGTLATFYAQLDAPVSMTTLNPGPAVLPLAVTQLVEVSPAADPQMLLGSPTFHLIDEFGALLQAGERAQALLYRYDRAMDLGQPERDKVYTRGVYAGDEVCVYDLAAPTPRVGCRVAAPDMDTYLSIGTVVDWQPEIRVSPLSSRTVWVTVTNVPTTVGISGGRLYPASSSEVVNRPFLPVVTKFGAVAYSARFDMATPVKEAHVRIWGRNGSTRTPEAVTNYALGGNPLPTRTPRPTPTRGLWDALAEPAVYPIPSATPALHAGAAPQGEENFVPAISPDGQVLLYTDVIFEKGAFYAVQKATHLPQAPAWATVIGDGYYVLKSSNAPTLTGYINFRYRQQDVPAGEEDFLTLYYWQSALAEWVALSTGHNPYYNEVSAPCRAEGLYVLMSSLQISLPGEGWNLMAYPVQATRPVTEALLSINDYYTIVYGYDAVQSAWRVYDKNMPPVLNTLKTLEFGRGYWISVTQAITMFMKGTQNTMARAEVASLPLPPATFYGPVLDRVVAGQPVTAWVGAQVCGVGETVWVGAQLWYRVSVAASAQTPGCGVAGTPVTFRIGDSAIHQSSAWHNAQALYLPLGTLHHATYLPLVLRARR